MVVVLFGGASYRCVGIRNCVLKGSPFFKPACTHGVFR
jgi:hypothetical protein